MSGIRNTGSNAPNREIKVEPEDDDVIIIERVELDRNRAQRRPPEYRRREPDRHRSRNFYDMPSEPCTSSSHGIRSNSPMFSHDFEVPQSDEEIEYLQGWSPEYVEESHSDDECHLEYPHLKKNTSKSKREPHRFAVTSPAPPVLYFEDENQPADTDYRQDSPREFSSRFSEHGFAHAPDDPREPYRKRQRAETFGEVARQERRRYTSHRRSLSPPPLHNSQKRRAPSSNFKKPMRHEIPLGDYSDDDVTEPHIPSAKIVHPVPKSAVKFISENLSLITELTDCQLELLPDLLDYMDYQNVELKGTDEQIANAREKIDEWVVEDQQYRQRDNDVVHSILYVPVPEGVRDVICRRRELKSIENYAGVFSVELAKSCEEHAPIRIRGTLDDVLSAKEELQRRIAQRQKEIVGIVEKRVKIPRSCVGRVMGRGGETLARIRQESDVIRSSLLPDTGDDFRIILVAGKPEQIHRFKEQIEELTRVSVSRDAPVDTDEGVYKIELKREQVGRLIGRRGRTIREIRERSGAKVMVEEETVTVSGKLLEADFARHLVHKHIGEIDFSTPYEDLSSYNNLSKVKPIIRTSYGKVVSS